MSAREDAIKRPPRPSAGFTTLILATLAGVALGVLVALVNAPPSLPLFEARAPWVDEAPVAPDGHEARRPGESVEIVAVPGGRELRVCAPRAPQARRLAAQLAFRRAAHLDELEAARAALVERWRSRLLPSPLPPFSPPAECASLLLADAQRRRELVAALPAVYASAGAAPPPTPVPAVGAEESALARSAAAADPEACRRALFALAAAEDARDTRGVPSARAPAPERVAAWRRAQLDRADSLAALAARMLVGETPLQQDLAVAGAPERLVLLAADRPDPYAPLAANAAVTPITVSPLAGSWAGLLGAGGALGGIAACVCASLGLRLRRVRRTGREPFQAERDPDEALPWLHVVAGPTPASVVRAALELAAHSLARRDRVLVIDAGARLRLHERLGRESRWGLTECLQGDMPVLGLVQYGGRPGFYLLAHGHAALGGTWAGLGRCLDDARLHFGRIILAIDATAQHALGDALAGRALEGWWGAPVTRLPDHAVALSARLGIAFSGIDLSGLPEASLEALSRRVGALAALLPPAPEVMAEPIPEPVLPAFVPPAPEPIVLDCDLQVRQRLRFLVWMRRVQSEGRQAGARIAPR
jgi:hypothetical protein